jgi:hypothetical protein
MAKFSGLIALVLAILALPSIAAAAPTSSQITAPAGAAFVTYDNEKPSSLHVAGTTSGGTGDVDLRCYYGTKGPVVASNVPVTNGSFATDVPVTQALLNTLGDNPEPFCLLRAVPAGTIPAAPPGQASVWTGVAVGWGQHRTIRLGASFAPAAPDTIDDFFLSRAQSGAMNDFYSLSSCGLCDTYLFAVGAKTPSNPIWWSNAAVFANPDGVSGRNGMKIDGANAYSGASAYYNKELGNSMADNAGFPAVSETHTVDPLTGDVTIHESAPYVVCAEDRLAYPPTNSSCASFADSGVHYERTIRTTNSGFVVTIVDHWKSVDGKPHDIDAIYEDIERSENYNIAGRGGRVQFMWDPGAAFDSYPSATNIVLPDTLPATALVKTDASTSSFGDNVNPFGAVIYGARPSEIKAQDIGDGHPSGIWTTRYQRTIPAGGDVSMAFAYTHDFALDDVQSRRAIAQVAVTPPTVGIDAPADGATVDAGSVHVTGTAASADGQVSVTVNGVATAVSSDGHWSADVPLNEGANQIVAAASNKIGFSANAIATVTRPAAPATSGTPASTSTVPVVTPKTVRCVVPKLRGKSLARAKVLLKRAHCRLGKVSRKASSKVKPGRVIKSRFKAGSRHAAGSRVRVTVAKKA